MSSSTVTNQFSKMCRLCMDKNVLLVNIHPQNGKVKHSPGNIVEVIEKFTTVKIDPWDKLPQKICESCIQTINSMLAFRDACKRSNDELRKMIGKAVDDAKNTIEISDDDGDTKENSVGNGDNDAEFSFEPSDDDVHAFPFASGKSLTGPDSANDRDCVDDIDEFEVNKRPRPEKIACHICGKLYVTHEMKYHINEHNGLKPFECNEPNCTSKFAGPHYLSKHKRLCHKLKPKVFCDVCGSGNNKQR